jgi:hypothetical protein
MRTSARARSEASHAARSGVVRGLGGSGKRFRLRWVRDDRASPNGSSLPTSADFDRLISTLSFVSIYVGAPVLAS